MKSRLLLDVVIGESSAILKLLAGKDETLLVWRNPFLILDFSLNIFYGIARLHLESDCLACQSLDEDLHSTSETKNQMKCWLLLDVVVRKSSAILKLLAREDETLLVWRNSFLILDLCLYIFDSITRLHLQSNCLASQGLNEDLHSTSETKNQMESRLLLNVVVWESSAILKLLASKDETLLIWRNSFLILDLSFYILNSVWWFYFQGDGFTGQGLHKYLHTTTESQH